MINNERFCFAISGCVGNYSTQWTCVHDCVTLLFALVLLLHFHGGVRNYSVRCKWHVRRLSNWLPVMRLWLHCGCARNHPQWNHMWKGFPCKVLDILCILQRYKISQTYWSKVRMDSEVHICGSIDSSSLEFSSSINLMHRSFMRNSANILLA